MLSRALSDRTLVMYSTWLSKVPCDRFSRAMFIPVVIKSARSSGEPEAGPIVATILVRLIRGIFLLGITGNYHTSGDGTQRKELGLINRPFNLVKAIESFAGGHRIRIKPLDFIYDPGWFMEKRKLRGLSDRGLLMVGRVTPGCFEFK
jgi:hypothetical protein